MNAPSPPHPTDQILYAYGLGKLGDPAASAVDSHLEGCDACRHRVSELSGDSFVSRLRDAGARPDTPAPGPPRAGVARASSGPSAPPVPDPALAATLPPELADNPQYEVIRELGRGGMGVVYLARNIIMDRLEVLKVLNKEMLERKGTYDRFLREIRSAARLNHPNVVGAYSALQIGHLLVFAMEYVEGQDLTKLVKSRGPLPVAYACSFVSQAALGLQHAHERGMVHRDIKPGNLMLTRQGQRGIVKILDFGLARASSENPIDGGLTREGQMLGTPDYIAPEQIRDAQSADIRADIYSLGCTFYYLLTGGPPFREEKLWDLYQAHFSMDADPLNVIRPDVPSELAALVARMMAKEPARRFQTPAEAVRALVPFLKPGNSGSGSSDGERSQPGEPAGGSSSSGMGLAPPHSAPAGASPGPGPGNASREASKPSEPGAPCESLTAIREPEPGSEAPAVPEPWRSRPPWLGLVLAVGVLLFAFVVAWAAGVFKPNTDRARLVPSVASNPDKNGPNSPGLKPGAGLRTKGGAAVTLSKSEELWKGFAGEKFKTAFPAQPPTLAGPKPTPSGVPSKPALKPRGDWTSPTTKMEFVLIKGGEFMMGSPEDSAPPEEKPQHKVRISPFFLGATEVTQTQYLAMMGNNPSWFSSTGGGKDQVAGRSTDQFPVEGVPWLDAVRFCNAVSKKDGFTPYYEVNGENMAISAREGPGYRLPTEAEWEYACRAGRTGKYSFGNDSSVLGEYGWFAENSGGISHPVGEKHPNEFGLYDMHGNVSERCSDRWEANYDKWAPGDDPLGSPGPTDRVIRGGVAPRAALLLVNVSLRVLAGGPGARPGLSRGPSSGRNTRQR